jgi:uncharacterized OsmC-like protein
MKPEELRNLQTPLKVKYREQPELALITLRATGKPGEGISCKVETGKAILEAGLHPAAGGDGMLYCSGDLLLEALVACAGVTLSAVAASMGIIIKDASVIAEGDMDFRGTLAVSRDVPVGFKALRLSFILDCDASQEQIQNLLKLTERYCVVYQTIVSATGVTTSIERRQ